MMSLKVRSLNKVQLLFLVIVIALYLLPLFKVSILVLHIIIYTLLFAYVATAWNIVGGMAGQLSLTHGAFLGIGAYAAALLFMNNSISPWITLPLAMVIGAGAAALIGYPCFKFGLRGAYFAIASLMFNLIFVELLIVWREFTGGSLGLSIKFINNPLYFQFATKEPYYWIILTMWIAIILLIKKAKKLRYYLAAIRENEDAAAALGISVRKYKLMATVISGALTAAVGVFYAQYFMYVNPEGTAGVDMSIEILLIALIGGKFTILGPTIGATIIVPLSEYLRYTLGGTYAGLHRIIFGIVLIMLVLLLPQGIWGRIDEKWKLEARL
jgi:branched-chain amino acid transport system permease protein